MSIKIDDIKLLFGKSGNICAFPECYQDLSIFLGVRNQEKVIANMCHIVGKSKSGPRGNNEKSNKDIYENLILLCPTHHAIIDKDILRYTENKLRQIKKRHEYWVKDRLSIGKPIEINVIDFYYLNIPRLLSFSMIQGYDYDFNAVKECSSVDYLIDLPNRSFEGYLRLLLYVRDIIKNIQFKTIDINDIKQFDKKVIGTIVSFNHSFYTKNVPGIDKIKQNFSIKGDIDKDPCIHYKINNKTKFLLQIDPKWLTSNTSFTTLKSGRGKFSGVGIIKDMKQGYIIATPLFIGIPKPIFYDELFFSLSE